MKEIRSFFAKVIYCFITVTISLPVFAQEQNNSAKDWAVVSVSVCNMRVSGDYDAGMETQGLLGEPVKILKDGRWLYVEQADGDRSWVLSSSVVKMTAKECSQWNQCRQAVVTSIYAFVYSKPEKSSHTISDVVANNRLKVLDETKDFFHVQFPDGRKGYLSKQDAVELKKWRAGLKYDAQSIIATSKKLIGFPYMWGGTSTKGIDCSGFVRTALLMHDIIIPRNASQQAKKGKHIEIASDFSNLIPGDLVFFGRKAQGDTVKARVSHVGIYIGNKKFIHSLGYVHISSFNPADVEYDEYDLNRLLWAQRVLPYINKEEGLTTTDKNEIYK